MYRAQSQSMIWSTLRQSNHILSCTKILNGTIILRNTIDTPIATFTIYAGKITKSQANDTTCTIVKDCVIDNLKKRICVAFLGTRLKECTMRYVVIKNKKIIAEMYDDTLEEKIRFNCAKKYYWDITQEYQLSSQSDSSQKSYSSDTDIFNRYCENMSLDTSSNFDSNTNSKSNSNSSQSFPKCLEELQSYTDILKSICSDIPDEQTYNTKTSVIHELYDSCDSDGIYKFKRIQSTPF